jgi:N-terminal domain of anti-restriction factor ArdC
MYVPSRKVFANARHGLSSCWSAHPSSGVKAEMHAQAPRGLDSLRCNRLASSRTERIINMNKVEWANLLEQAVNEPGKINEAYRRFRGYSLGNRIWAMLQCTVRGVEPGPLASFHRWKELGRRVKKGNARSRCVCPSLANGSKPTRTAARPRLPINSLS